MKCKDCPFQYILESIDDSDDSLLCEIKEQPVSLLDECFFPETIMEKGI